jgi:selenide,water dikinase
VNDPRFVAGVGDDAAVWVNGDGYLAATVDFFTPIVDDVRAWGRIAAANSASDIYAMGGQPLVGLNLAVWPKELPLDLLGEVLQGAEEIAREGGWIVAGGHTIEGTEPLFGQSITGTIAREDLVTNAGAVAGQSIVLGKAIGTGIIATAVKNSSIDDVAHGGSLRAPYEAALASMTSLNRAAAQVVRDVGATACTDVTGFGLLGHLRSILVASNVGAVVELSAVPQMPGLSELIRVGNVPSGTTKNLVALEGHLDVAAGIGPDELAVLADPQTSGGLLFMCDAGRATDAVRRLETEGYIAAVLGETRPESPGLVAIR